MDKLEASLAEAASPDAPPQRLRALYSRDAPPKIKQALARNPSTPGALLFGLFVEYPNEVAANPALALARRADPGLLRPMELGKKFALAANPTLTEAALRLLIDGAPLRLLQLLSLRRDLSEEFLLTLADHGVDMDRLLRAPNAGAALWKKATQVRNKYVSGQNQIFLSRERDLPDEAKRLLAQQSDEEVGQSLQWREEPPIEQEIPAIEYAGATEGRPSKSCNEDRFALFRNQNVGLFLVADGMSGNSHTGHIAAEKICETVLAEIAKVDGPLRAQDFFHDSFYSAFHEIARSVFHSYDFSEYFRGNWFDTNGVAATVAALLLQGQRATIAHIGDCRVYLVRNGRLQGLTQDHTLLWEAEKSGQPLPADMVEQYRNVLIRLLGDYGVGSSPTMTRIQVLPGDRFVLCSDGVHATLPEAQLSAILQTHSCRDAVSQIMQKCQNAGGNDDMSVVVLHVS